MKIPNWKSIVKGTCLGLALTVGACSSFYTVPAESEGVKVRFGRHIETSPPGLHFKLPYGIDRVTKVPVTTHYTESFGFRTLQPGVDSTMLTVEKIEQLDDHTLTRFIKSTGYRLQSGDDVKQVAQDLLQREYLTLTGDLNFMDVNFVAQYRVKNSADFLFCVKDPISTLRDASLAVMKQQLGDGSIDEAISIGREEYETKIESEVQEILDLYKTGLDIITVKMQASNPPQAVRRAFDAVNEAKQEKETKVNEAMREYNRIVPLEMGKADELVKQAEAYLVERVNNAKGDSARFLKLWDQYKEAKDITEKRMYFETLEKVLGEMDIIIVDGAGTESGGLINLLNLGGEQYGKR